MTKERLEQYIYLQKELKDLEARIKKLENSAKEIVSDSVTASDAEPPYITHQVKISGIGNSSNTRLTMKYIKLSILKNKIETEKKEIEEWINNIPTSRERLVFRYRYSDNLTWQQVAKRIGERDESYPRRYIHDKYLKATENTENNVVR